MKKFLVLMLTVLAVGVSACARDTYSRNAKDLPVAAQQTLSNVFKSGVSLIKIDKDMFKTEYEVILTNGSEVKFDLKGNWIEVEMPQGKNVPDSIVPAGILQWVKSNHHGAKVIGIERKGSGYEVELSNGIDAKFNGDGSFRTYD